MSQFSDWERDYGSPYDRATSSVPLIDVIEMAGQQVEALSVGPPTWADLEPYARMVMEHSDGGLTLLGAASVVAHWRSARSDYETGGRW